MVAFIRRNSARPLSVKGMKREDTATYPAEALREVIVNAVAHRDYSDSGAKVSVEVFADRLRVSSPGLLPGGQSMTRLQSGEARSRARNPLVMQGLSWLELMDERGSGIRRMMRVLEQNGNPGPNFEEDDDSLVVEFAAPVKADDAPPPSEEAVSAEPPADDLPPREAILAEVRRSGMISTKICVQRLGIARATAQRILNTLTGEKLLEKAGSGPKIHYLPKS